MNKGAIQRFAIWARTELIAQVSQRAYQYGITKDGYGEQNAVTVGGRALTTDEQRQRKELVDQIRSKGYTQVMEEVAYTWFNRFIALRFMEVNNYLPSHIRVFSDSTGAFKPEILNDVLHLDLPGLNTEKVAEYIEKNQTEDLYRYLLLTQCNALNASLPLMFERMGGFTELLLPNNILKQDSILGHMVTDIPEEDWTDQVQIIGWLYQYYNSELKDDTFALLKKNVKITKERIPSATQLFTPDWIVRYMVENSLGRIFIDKRKNEGIFADGRGADEMIWDESEAKRIANEKYIAEQMGWKYYLPEAEQTQEVRQQLDEIQNEYANLDVKEIKVIDPCMGSGHILVYAFDVLMQIYEANGYSQRDAAQSILENNLYGLDIDDRAAQLAYFAVMMKARQYDRRIFSRGIQPHVYAIQETGWIGGAYQYEMGNFLLSKDHQETLNYLLDTFRDAKEYGSIIRLEDRDYVGLMEAWKYTASQTTDNFNLTLWYDAVRNAVPVLIEQAILLSSKYDVVITNPPYMGGSGMSVKLNDYVKRVYPDTKSDMSTVCMDTAMRMCKSGGFVSMINIPVWMFLTSYSKLRKKILSLRTIDSMLHLGRGVFGADFGTTAFVIRNKRISAYKGVYRRLFEKPSSVDSEETKKKLFFSDEKWFYAKQESFMGISDTPIVYWLSDTMLSLISSEDTVGKTHDVGSGLSTADNERFLRYHWEVPLNKVAESGDEKGKKWFHFQKGGEFRRWYGNLEYVVNWENDGADIKYWVTHNPKDPGTTSWSRRIFNVPFYFQHGITWAVIGIGKISFRETNTNAMISNAAGGIFTFSSDEEFYNLLGGLNSKIWGDIFQIISPTVNYSAGIIQKAPMPKAECSEIVKGCITISKHDWDSFETSWDFLIHPLVLGSYAPDLNGGHKATLVQSYAKWERVCEDRFNKLKANEEELNRIFIDIYGLQDELTPEVEDKDVTVRKADLGRDIRSLISYAVGCMFGRYSLDEPGLAYAGGEWDASKYSTIIPDKDNIIPICDDDYFDDDMTGRFVKWVETVYGSDTLEENLKFIADALGGKGTPREVIRNYFINDFYADHLKIYQKRPIYWLFDSGKKNGFKALVYMHRYQSDLLARMRTDYVHEQQERYRTQLMHLADAIDHASASERVKLTKQQKKIQEQSLEIQKYEEKVHHLADQNIQIDLDDGVKHNYELFADVLAKIK